MSIPTFQYIPSEIKNIYIYMVFKGCIPFSHYKILAVSPMLHNTFL